MAKEKEKELLSQMQLPGGLRNYDGLTWVMVLSETRKVEVLLENGDSADAQQTKNHLHRYHCHQFIQQIPPII